MKKRKLLIGILAVGVAAMSLASCEKKEDKEDNNPPVDVVTDAKVSYYNGDALLGTETVKIGEKARGNVKTDLAGYEFEYWCTDSALTTKYDLNTVVQADITLYAKYNKYYTISFDSNGGNEIKSIKHYAKEDILLEMPKKEGFIFSHWEDSNGEKYAKITSDDAKDLSLKAVYNEVGKRDVLYQSLATDFEAGKLANKKNGIFTFTAEVRARIKQWINPENKNDTLTWDYSYKLGSTSAFISFTAPEDGKLSLYVQNGSDTSTQTIKITGDDNSSETITFSGNAAVAPYPAGSPVVKIDLDIKKGVTYKVARGGSGTVDVFQIDVVCKLDEEEVTNIEITDEGIVDYLEGMEFDPSKIQIAAVHGDNLYSTELKMDAAIVDASKVDVSKPGVYEVTVKYAQYKATFDVNVYAVEEIELGFNETYTSRNSYNGIYVNGKVKTIYSKEDELNTKYLSVTANAKINDSKTSFIIKDEEAISFSGFDSSKTGEQTITVSYKTNNKEFKSEYKVYVVDTSPYKNADAYVVTVDKSYTGAIGVADGENGNMFTTIGQALEFLSKVDSSSSKIINVKAGYYNEKLEINIPNLTIIGAGSCNATCSKNENYNAAKYNAATIIEWDSLYGIPDESGFSQITDSTATVAVREEAVNCTIKNITLSNYWNCEEIFTGTKANLDYLTQMGIAVSGKVNDHRALALIVQADKFTMDGCSLLGYQDTVEFMTGRQFIYNTHISGNTDYIFGTNATTYFYNCNIHVAYKGGSSGYITAFKGCNSGASDYVTYGLIFDKCSFTADSKVAVGSFAIGRPWGAYSAVMTMNSEIGAHVGKTLDTRYVSMGGINPSDDTVKYTEYNNTGDSAITKGGNQVAVLSEAEAANYNNISIIFGKVNGQMTYKDSWTPNLYTQINNK